MGAVTNDDEIARRKQLTFAQAEGASPLPTQLKRTDVSQELRAVLWKCIHDEIKSSAESDSFVWYSQKTMVAHT